MIKRHPEWRARLNTFLADADSRPFVWGEWDCCIGLMAGWVRAVRGDEYDYAPPYTGRYTTLTDAFRALRKVDGVKTPAELMTKWFGEPKAPAFARDGDLVLFGDCIGGMYRGEGRFIGTEMMGDAYARDGLVRVPRAELEACWHV